MTKKISKFSGADLNLAAERSYPTPMAQSALLPLLLLSLARQKNSPDTAKIVKDEYDYVIVGSGMSGSVVASRLSEVPCVSVLLLEAGPPPPRINDVPVFALSFWYTDLDWNYVTAPQKHAGLALLNRQLLWPSGKAVGGSSILYDGLYIRGNRKDYDDWAAMGAKGWSYEEVLPYFRKLEDNRNYVNAYHGMGGPQTVMRPSWKSQFKSAVFRAAKSMGYKIVDPNGPRQTGFFDPQVNVRDNQRCSVAKAYLVPAENRENLDILPNAMVEKVIIKNKRATGVRFGYAGKTFEVRARREVIVSAGAVNTAQLLMLSGIGPKEELQKLNISVHADLPVGQNFHDQPSTLVLSVLGPEVTPLAAQRVDPEEIKRYIHNRTGALAAPLGVTSMAFLYKDEVIPKRDYPNYEVYFVDTPTTVSQFVLSRLNLNPEVVLQALSQFENRTLVTCVATAIHPRSRGTVTLRSADPYAAPIIDPNFLEDDRDLEDLVQAMKACRKISESPQLKELGSTPVEIPLPACAEYIADEDSYFGCRARHLLMATYHPCSTARMGNPKDPWMVVDSKLRVKNIRGLRVVDNSIMPKITSGNTGVPAIMIGEKASDIIKESTRCHFSPNSNQNHFDIPFKSLFSPSAQKHRWWIPHPSFIKSEENSYSDIEAEAELPYFHENNDYDNEDDYE